MGAEGERAGGEVAAVADEVLTRLGLGGVKPAAVVTRLAGRNSTWTVSAGCGMRVFVKSFIGTAPDTLLRMRRSLAVERFIPGTGFTSFAVPRCLGCDERSRLAVFEFVAGAKPGHEVAADGEFGEVLAARVGTAVGELHGFPAGAGPGSAAAELDGPEPALPSLDLLQGLPLPVFASGSAAELQAWRLMQRDELLVTAIASLLGLTRRAPSTPCHCDLRLEQFLLAEGRLYLCDWEEFRLADPARDVGSFAGEWLHRAVMSLHREGEERADRHDASDGDIIGLMADAIERMRPVVAAFWSGYRQARPAVDAGLARRAAGFAGWHLYDRMLAAARRAPRLGALHRAAAGVGRAVLLEPGRSAATLGLVDAP